VQQSDNRSLHDVNAHKNKQVSSSAMICDSLGYTDK